jgi:unsaturated rhamnogalacturonyl hydrolase
MKCDPGGKEIRFARRFISFIGIVCSLGLGLYGSAQEQPWSQRMAKTIIQRWPKGSFQESNPVPEWDYQLGFLLQGMEAVGDRAALGYVRQAIDQLVTPDGTIPTFDTKVHSVDDILLGRQLLFLYKETGEAKYRKAAQFIRSQVATQPRNRSGGYWHNAVAPDRMLLDDEYMVAPFLAEYAITFQEPQDFADIAHQFALLEEHTRDTKTELVYQEWNEPRTEPWVNKATGASASFWGRGTGWYIMGLVDTLPNFPEKSRDRAMLLTALNRTAEGIARHQDKESGLWYQVLDKPGEKDNYLESSAAGMFVYALAKGVRLGYLPPRYLTVARNGWKGMQDHFVQTNPSGAITITSTVKGIDLGGPPSHNGSYAYYVSAPVVSNDPKGVAAFLLAASEMEKATR